QRSEDQDARLLRPRPRLSHHAGRRHGFSGCGRQPHRRVPRRARLHRQLPALAQRSGPVPAALRLGHGLCRAVLAGKLLRPPAGLVRATAARRAAERDAHGMTAMAQTHGKRVFSSLIWAAVRIWGMRLGGLIVFFILARLLTPEDFGVYASLWALLLF